MGVTTDKREEDLTFLIDYKDLTMLHGHVQSLRLVAEIMRQQSILLLLSFMALIAAPDEVKAVPTATVL
jgi:hypothetical protein